MVPHMLHDDLVALTRDACDFIITEVVLHMLSSYSTEDQHFHRFRLISHMAQDQQ